MSEKKDTKDDLTKGDMTAAEKDAADIQNQEQGEKGNTDFEPLFGDGVSEEDLQGVDPEKEAADKADKEAKEKAEEEKKTKEQEDKDKKASDDKSPPEEKPADSEPKGDEKKDEAKSPETDETKKDDKEEEKKAEGAEPDYSKPPPTGYVPLPAVQEERRINVANRDENRVLKAQVTQLQGEIETAKSQAPTMGSDDEFKDFKVLSDEEFEELNDDNSDKASAYTYKFIRYNQFMNEKARREQAATSLKQNEAGIVQGANERVKSIIPSIDDEGSKEVNELIDFAVGQGFNENYLGILTDPKTRIIPPGNKNSYVLGDGAASLTEIIHKFHQLSKSDPEKLRSEIKAETEKQLRGSIEKEIREKVTQELMSKLNENPDGFRSIDTVPGSETSPKGDKTFITEAELSKMSEEEQERLLTGQG